MKYEEIEVGESYEYNIGHKLKVISKNDDYKAVMTIDEDEEICGWDENELELFKPIKKELPESGLLVCGETIIYRNGVKSGFGFNHLEEYGKRDCLSFISNPNEWRTATPEEEAKFIKILKAEAEKRGLGVDAKIKGHADGARRHSANSGANTPIFILTEAWNKNGIIFHNGIWAQPITMLDEVCDVVKKHLPNIVVEQIDGVVTLKQL